MNEFVERGHATTVIREGEKRKEKQSKRKGNKECTWI
jgi:hypothetical protein